MRNLLLLLMMLFSFCSIASAGKIEDHAVVAVMDFGTHPGAATSDVALANAEMTSSEYIILKLINDGKFVVIDKDTSKKAFDELGIKTVGLIDPDRAKKIGELLKVKYLIYGNVNDITVSDTGVAVLKSGTTIHTVKAHIIARVLDIDSGTIIAAAKGEGQSKSSYTEINTMKFGIKVGNAVVTQESVHNALQKAAYNTVDALTQRIYGK